MKANNTYVFARVILLDALPCITAGFRMALSLTLIIVAILEMFIGTDKGLGYLIYNTLMIFKFHRYMLPSLLSVSSDME